MKELGWILITIGLCKGCGCLLTADALYSQWALDDPRYDAKYIDDAAKAEVPDCIKQASDARFQSGSRGILAAGDVCVHVRRPTMP